MKAIFEFDLPEEDGDYKVYSQAWRYHFTITEMLQHLEGKLKYHSDEMNKIQEETYQEILDKLSELVEENELQLDV
jgi:hypothetical protein